MTPLKKALSLDTSEIQKQNWFWKIKDDDEFQESNECLEYIEKIIHSKQKELLEAIIEQIKELLESEESVCIDSFSPEAIQAYESDIELIRCIIKQIDTQ